MAWKYYLSHVAGFGCVGLLLLSKWGGECTFVMRIAGNTCCLACIRIFSLSQYWIDFMVFWSVSHQYCIDSIHITHLFYVNLTYFAFSLIFLQVRSTIKQKFSRWQDGRSVATRYTRASIAVSGEAINMAARGSLLSTNSAGALSTPNGRLSITSSSNKDFALRSPHRNNNENGFSHLSSTPMLRDEAL